MSMLPEIRMVDKLDGKEFKLGEYEHDEETGILYVGTHGTVFPGGSGTTGGGGGGGSNTPSDLTGVREGFKDATMTFRLIPFPRVDVEAYIKGFDFKTKVETRIIVLPRIDRVCSGNLSNLTINTSFRFES